MTSAQRPSPWLPGRYRSLELGAALVLLGLGVLSKHMSPEGNGWSAGSLAVFVLFVALLPLVRTRPGPALTIMTGLFLLAQHAWGLSPSFPMGLIPMPGS